MIALYTITVMCPKSGIMDRMLMSEYLPHLEQSARADAIHRPKTCHHRKTTYAFECNALPEDLK